jgi:phosphopantetheine--protein transferase-like protein
MGQAVGTDIVAVPRIAALIHARGTAFLDRWFTPREIEYCSGKAMPSRHFAARLAAKEATLKAMPIVWDGPLPWRSIEIVIDSRGAPSVRLSDAFLLAATRAGVSEISVSLSHCDEYATATALVAAAPVGGDSANPVDGGAWSLNADNPWQILRDYQASRGPQADPELEAVCVAILLEDVFGITLSDAEIDPVLLADSSAVVDLVTRLRRVGQVLCAAYAELSTSVIRRTCPCSCA